MNFSKNDLLKQGPGYNNFVKFTNSNFIEGNRLLLSQIKSYTLNPSTIYPIDQIINDIGPMDYLLINDIPIWLHSKAKPLH